MDPGRVAVLADSSPSSISNLYLDCDIVVSPGAWLADGGGGGEDERTKLVWPRQLAWAHSCDSTASPVEPGEQLLVTAEETMRGISLPFFQHEDRTRDKFQMSSLTNDGLVSRWTIRNPYGGEPDSGR